MPTVKIELSEWVFSALRKNPEELSKEMRAAAAKWYEMEWISHEKAAEIAGLSKAVSGAVKMMCFRRFENVCILRGSRTLSAATRTGLC